MAHIRGRSGHNQLLHVTPAHTLTIHKLTFSHRSHVTRCVSAPDNQIQELTEPTLPELR